MVVVSAMGDTTDKLSQIIAEATSNRASPREVLSMGERTASRVFAAALQAQGVRARLIDVDDPAWPIITDDEHTRASPLVELCASRIRENIVPILEDGIVVVLPGFIGLSKQGFVTTLGRGGSDTTALLIGSVVEADEAVFVTDVEGILTADPKLVADPALISELTVDELIGLADVGFKFLHGKALRFKKGSVNIRVISNKASTISERGTTIRGSFPELKVELYSPEPLASITIVGRELGKSLTLWQSF